MKSFDHIKFIKYNTFINICINDIQKYVISLINLAIVVKTFARYRTYNISAKKDINILIKHMRCSNKI